MRKCFLALILLVSLAFADRIIIPDALPEKIKSFIQNNFTKAQIGLAQQDDDEFEVYLSDGTELEFDISGEWKDIEAGSVPLSFSILPANIASIVQNEYPNAFLVEIKRKIYHYKIKLSNNIELSIDFNGSILRREYDD